MTLPRLVGDLDAVVVRVVGVAGRLVERILLAGQPQIGVVLIGRDPVQRIGDDGLVVRLVVGEGRLVVVGVVLLDHLAAAVVDVAHEGVAVGVGDGQQAVVGVVGVGRDLAGDVGDGRQVAVAS